LLLDKTSTQRLPPPVLQHFSPDEQSLSFVHALQLLPMHARPVEQSALLQQLPAMHPFVQHTSPGPQSAFCEHPAQVLVMQAWPPEQSAVEQQFPGVHSVAPEGPQQTSPFLHCFDWLQVPHWLATQPWPPEQSAPEQQSPVRHWPPQHFWPDRQSLSN
jgi:hypothetical protein